jgi:ATP-dependent exoDNAse (exonuclease V) alpha subunit
MAVYFLNMKTFGRANGSSATSAIAYRAGERIRDERTGKIFDHRKRGGVLHTEIVLPERLADADMSWARDRANLWNRVEAAETRSNSRVAREFLVALPAELDTEQRLGLVRGFSQELADRHRFVVDFAIHAPRTDPRNFHAHLLTSTREIHSTGFGAKTALEISDQQRLERGMSPFFQELVDTRARWAQRANEALGAARIAARIDHRSLAAQGIDREPALHLPRPIYEMERRGERNAVADRLRAEHQARVAERVQRAVKEMAAARQSGRPQSLEDVRRQARENWLRMRAEARGEAPPDRADRDVARRLGRSREDDLGR